MDRIKISVVIITYNQAQYITRALESVLSQKEWIHEIIVSDDCSKDNNWDIICSYAKEYPRLIRAYRNDNNLGIYGNMNAAFSKVTGNVISMLSADDEYAPDYLSLAHQVINKEKVMGTAFLCYFDRYRKFADNRPNYLFRNNLVLKYNPVKLLIRQLICEASFMSVKILERVQPSVSDGLYADILWEISRASSADRIIYYPSVSHIYNAGIGVSKTIPKLKRRNDFISLMDKLIINNICNIQNIGKRDLNYLRFRREAMSSYSELTIKSFCKASKMFFASLTLSNGFKYMRLDKYIWYVVSFMKIYLKRDKE